MAKKRKAKLTPLQRLVNRNETQVRNLRKKRANIVKEHDNILDVLDEKIAEHDALLKQLKKK